MLVIAIISHLLAKHSKQGDGGAHTSSLFSVQLIAAAGLIHVELSLDVSSQQESQSETPARSCFTGILESSPGSRFPVCFLKSSRLISRCALLYK